MSVWLILFAETKHSVCLWEDAPGVWSRGVGWGLRGQPGRRRSQEAFIAKLKHIHFLTLGFFFLMHIKGWCLLERSFYTQRQ